MDEIELKKLRAELFEATGRAIAILAGALCHQIDPKKLAADLKAEIAAASSVGLLTPSTAAIVKHIAAATDAEAALPRGPAKR